MVGEGKELLKQSILGLARRLSPRLETLLVASPDLLDQFLDAVVGAIRTETRAVLSGMSRLKDDRLAPIAGQVMGQVDEEALVDRITPLLATRLASWFEKDSGARQAFGDAVAAEFMRHLDIEEFAHEVAEQVADRLADRVRSTLPTR